MREVRFTAPDGVRLAGVDWGGSGCDVLLLHGGGGNLGGWLELAELLRDGFRVAAFDHRAHGASDAADPPYHFDDVRNDAAAAIAALGLVRPLLVGHSLGGGLALRHASEHGDIAGVVALDGPAAWRPGERPEPRIYTEEALRERGFGWRGTEAELEARLQAVDDHVRREELRRGHQRAADGLFEMRPSLAFILEGAPHGPFPYTTDLYRRIECPVLLLMAERGLYVEQHALLEEVAATREHVTVEWLACDHGMHFALPKEIAARIRAFALPLPR